MELPSKLLEQIAFFARPKVEEHMLTGMDNSTHDENLYQPLQTNRHFKIAVTFITGYKGIFNVTYKIFTSFSQDQLTMMISMVLPFQRERTDSRA